jgi:hypothetical protein
VNNDIIIGCENTNYFLDNKNTGRVSMGYMEREGENIYP